MYKRSSQRQHKIYKIAETDLSYQVWSKTFEECRDAFTQFADSQPQEIRSILYGYADSGENCLTKTEGVFVAGDCRKKRIRQVATACADGAIAALAACDYVDAL